MGAFVSSSLTTTFLTGGMYIAFIITFIIAIGVDGEK